MPRKRNPPFQLGREPDLDTDRRISISRIDGVLSSNARVGRITIADREGVWLTIEDAEIV